MAYLRHAPPRSHPTSNVSDTRPLCLLCGTSTHASRLRFHTACSFWCAIANTTHLPHATAATAPPHCCRTPPPQLVKPQKARDTPAAQGTNTADIMEPTSEGTRKRKIYESIHNAANCLPTSPCNLSSAATKLRTTQRWINNFGLPSAATASRKACKLH